MKLWQKKGTTLHKEIEQYTVGNDPFLDQKLVKVDAIASIAHASMLNKINILTKQELKALKKELCNIIKLDKKNKFKITLKDEDVHTKIENHLTKKLGKLGKKIHTGRSRNDQVIVDTRLYSKEKLLGIEEQAIKLCQALAKQSQKNQSTPMPGYTHMQKAMPSSVGLWLGSFAESLLDYLELLDAAYKLNNQNPLGSAAGYGVPLNLDRNMTTKLLGFAKTQNNILYVQNSRGKIELAILNALTQIMLDLNKLATDLLLFTMQEFQFFEIPDEFCTGSSIMPHKKNKDVLELIRANYGIMLGYSTQIANIISSLPSGYNRDLQLTKEPLMAGLELANSTLSICTLVISKLEVNKKNLLKACTPELFATGKAFELAKKGIPFREAYKTIKNTNEWHKSDATKNIMQKKYAGATGNLGLPKLEKEIAKKKKIISKKQHQLNSTLNKLLRQ